MAYQQPPNYSAYPQGQPAPGPGYQPAYHQPGPGYQPAPPQQYAQQQQTNNVVVVAQQPAQVHTTRYVQDDSPNHLLHCIITLLCPWWIFIWFIVCCVYGC